ncbi:MULTISPECIES: hypothetical protein [unclassified Duganella]|uniref:hypothetical protein n=1 Tax=unclassified Duganella TaxID=2636909 RepID=UPI000A42A6F0|nr:MULTISPECIES: hypothetical protein [unclassified Duganella]
MTSTLVMVGMLIACQVKEDVEPPAPVVEAVAKKLAEHGGAAAERRMREWAEQGSPVAARELGLLYVQDAAKHNEAMRLLEKAALAGDSVSVDYLSTRFRSSATVANAAGAQGWPLYVQLANQQHTK